MTPSTRRYVMAYLALFAAAFAAAGFSGLVLQTPTWPWPLAVLFHIALALTVLVVVGAPLSRWARRAPEPVRAWTEDDL